MTDTTASVRSPSDAELITSARAGDDGAYSELYRRHEGAARAAARSLTRSRADVDDLVAEGFVRVLQALRNGRGPEVAFRPYLLTAVRNGFYDRTRRDKRVDVTAEPPEQVNLQLLDMANSDEDRAIIARAFATLPERWQLVLWHAEVENRSAGEIGELLGLAPNAVAALAYRAREGLRQAYLQAHLQREVPERCRESRSQLGGYVRDALSTRDRRKVEEHLDTCTACRGLLVELGEANRSLRVVLIPLLLGVPAAKYLAGLKGGGGLLLLFRQSNRSTQVAVGAGTAAAAAVAAVAVAAALSGGPTQPAALPPTTTRAPVISAPAATDPVDVSAPVVIPVTDPPVPVSSDPGGALPVIDTTIPIVPVASTAPRPTAAPVVPVTTPRTVPSTATPTSPPTAAPTAAPTAVPTVPPSTVAPATTAPPTTVPATTTTTLAPLIPLDAAVSSSSPLVAGQYAYLGVSLARPAGAAGPLGIGVASADVTLGGPARRALSPTVSFDVPSGTTLGAIVGSSWACDQTGSTVRCSGPDIAAGTTSTVLIELRLPVGIGSEVTFRPVVTGPGLVDRSTPVTFSVAPGDGIEYLRRIRGGLTTIGNSSLTCVGGANCTTAQAGGGPDPRRQAHEMGYVDVDAAASFNSSSAELAVPAGATVDQAVLVWSSVTVAGGGGVDAPDPEARGTVQFTGPHGTETVVGAVEDDGTSYVAHADVSSMVGESGSYTVADIQAATGVGRFGGWALMVAYRDPAAPESLVVIVSDTGAGQTIFGAPRTVDLGAVPTAAAPRAGSLSLVMFEGDLTIAGESVQINGQALEGPRPGDLFDSSIPSGRSPAYVNNFGVDIDSSAITVSGTVEAMTLTIHSPNDRLRWGLGGWTVAL